MDPVKHKNLLMAYFNISKGRSEKENPLTKGSLSVSEIKLSNRSLGER